MFHVEQVLDLIGGPGRTRTYDKGIMSPFWAVRNHIQRHTDTGAKTKSYTTMCSVGGVACRGHYVPVRDCFASHRRHRRSDS